MSWWKADRWIKAAAALDGLPAITDALETGVLGIDKVVELCRFATAETEGALIGWASEATCATIRRRADLEVRAALDETAELERDRTLRYWYEDGGRRFGLEARMPSAQGAIVAKALERVVDQIPTMPAHTDGVVIEARRADALLAMCSQHIAADADADRATVVVHASLEALSGRRNAETEQGAVMPPEALQRLACDARIQFVAESDAGDAISLGRTKREPSPSMMRQLRHRDRGCRFPGCGSTAFANAHHIVWWSRGGLHRPRQPVAHLRVPPSARPRARVDGQACRGRTASVVQGRRLPVSRRTGTDRDARRSRRLPRYRLRSGPASDRQRSSVVRRGREAACAPNDAARSSRRSTAPRVPAPGTRSSHRYARCHVTRSGR